MKAPSCEIFGIVARDAPRIVLFRHGPSGHNQLILWLTDRDEFIRGQWLKARLCPSIDLSPNGSLLVYSAKRYGSTERCWTAISRPPFFSALVAWSVSSHFDYGGIFEANDIVRLFGAGPDTPTLTGYAPETLKIQYGPSPRTFAEQAAAFELRSQWRIHAQMVRKWEKDPAARHVDIPLQSNTTPDSGSRQLPCVCVPWEPLSEPIRPRDSEDLRSLTLVRQGGGFEIRKLASYWSLKTVILSHQQSHSQYVLRGINWIVVDGRDRVIFTLGGCVLACRANPQGEPVIEILADFTSDRFESIPPPDSAMRW